MTVRYSETVKSAPYKDKRLYNRDKYTYISEYLNTNFFIKRCSAMKISAMARSAPLNGSQKQEELP